MKKPMKLALHYILLMAALFAYHFYIGMGLLEIATLGFIYYSVGFLLVLVVADQLLHAAFGLK